MLLSVKPLQWRVSGVSRLLPSSATDAIQNSAVEPS